MLSRLYLLVCLLGFGMQPTHAIAEQTQSITVYMTVDWEGWSLDEENLEAIRDFRARNPHIPMLHLLNPVYYLRTGADASKITQQIHSTLLPIDATGLHLHGWKSLVEHCQIDYQDSPSFAVADEACKDGDCGYTVSLELAYSEAELTQLVACSADLLRQNGFEQATHFRAGGWQFGPKLAAAIQQNGFHWDSSRIAPHLVAGSWGEQSAMVQMLNTLHPQASVLDQPREMLPGLMQYPNNAGLMDYTRTEQLVAIFQTLTQENKRVMVMGFHQETAFDFLDNLEDAMLLMQEHANVANVELLWGSYD